jgi:hydrogenase expression/formation protein HypC
MCLAVPMRVVRIDRYTAWCEAKGVGRNVSLTLLGDEPVAAGDYVLVHVGYALQTVSAQEAAATWDLLDQIALELEPVGG